MPLRLRKSWTHGKVRTDMVDLPLSVMDRKIEKKKWAPKKIAWIVAVALFAGLSTYGLLKDRGLRKLNVEAERLTISAVEYGPFQEFTPVRGKVLPILTVYLDAQEGGRVEEIFLEEGAIVEKGDAIVRLDNPDLQLHVMGQEAELERRIEELNKGQLEMEQKLLASRREVLDMEHKLQIDKRNYERYAALDAKVLTAIIAKQKFEELRDEYDISRKRKELMEVSHAQDSLLAAARTTQLEAALERMGKNIEIVRTRLHNLTVRAPVTGQLTALEAEIGETKAKGTRLGQVDVLDGFRVRARIDEHYISRIGRGQHGTFEYDDEPEGLVIHRVYPEVVDGSFEVDLLFEDEAPAGIRRGQTLHIRLELGDLDEALQVARGGFYQSTGGNWAFVLDKAGDRAVRRKIKLGRQNVEVYEVIEGLRPGDQVITSSYENFGDDMDVLVLE